MTVRIGFGGGCHWCTEAVFQQLRGVLSVEQGFIASAPPADIHSEAVIVSFDPHVISVEVLAEVHLRTHASTAAHSMRGKYRSAIYAFDEGQQEETSALVAKLQPDFEGALITQVLPFVSFKASDERFQNYYAQGPDRPFCTRYIDPKLDLLRIQFKRHLAVG
ncbi:peptide-methionine (S)-S-oxide reductase [Roseibium hamelinense]|uniref:peptide-methionine (S)-S-oxide reductase n=1 Tax=Roseibium hamelinense TaxID=150831 RepID=A0A562TGW0_9HYPH|nr:peptide-methionine (S)-S-oxide reductase [Roseibium hamelinense]MTI45946.1 peptide methionine sulfoxide reductase [Roseibium hamelinense]TWI92869.1 peptide-methionine (S)-S-oxide reductase [Roseibium hamelinense]